MADVKPEASESITLQVKSAEADITYFKIKMGTKVRSLSQH